jgi:bacterioferritin (cytochrome b1)
MRPKKTTASAKPTRAEIVDDLNRLMAEEAEACLRYFQMRFRLRGQDSVVAEPLFDEAVRETLEHATAIAAQIRALGHVPALRITLSLPGTPVRLETALAEALDVEQQALDAYTDFLPRVAGDPALEAFIRRQIEVETEHVEEMRTFVRTHAAVKLVPARKARRRSPR